MKQQEKVALVAGWHKSWHQVLLRLLKSRLASDADVQDLAQEVYLRLLRFDRLDLVENPRAYLLRVAANVVEEWRLKARQSKVHTAVEEEHLVTSEDGVNAVQSHQSSHAVRDALAALPTTCRTVLVLHCRDDMTYEQIALHLGISRRMVKRHVANGYAVLRDRLDAIR